MIKLSKEHGLNPTMGICYLCGEPTGEIGLLGRLPNDKRAPRYSCVSKEPCDKCKENMKQGIMIIEVDGVVTKRTGRIWVVKEDAIKDERLLKTRAGFFDIEVCKQLGLT